MKRVLITACIVLSACGVERKEPEVTATGDTTLEGAAAGPAGPLLGMRSGIYHVADLEAARQWYAELLGVQPYFNEPYYVGFNVAGFELGLNPDTAQVKPGAGGALLYWGVENADSVFARLIELGATQVTGVTDVGGGIRHAVVQDPFGNLFGIMENPNFGLESL